MVHIRMYIYSVCVYIGDHDGTTEWLVIRVNQLPSRDLGKRKIFSYKAMYLSSLIIDALFCYMLWFVIYLFIH